jgi:hypothetical protein
MMYAESTSGAKAWPNDQGAKGDLSPGEDWFEVGGGYDEFQVALFATLE